MSAMADGVIGIPVCLPDRDRLRRELEAFVLVSFGKRGPRMAARGGAHDDAVAALGLLLLAFYLRGQKAAAN